MGALSSWAMLALTHHIIMQYCSWLRKTKKFVLDYHTWETRYEVLGDDIVIFDADLAKTYLEVMSLLGVPINEKKSVVAKNIPVVEYAKRLSIFGKDCSALSWKQFMSLDSLKGRLSLIVSLIQKDKSFSLKPVSVISTVMKKTPWDRRVSYDTLALFALLNTYFTKVGTLMQTLHFIVSSRVHIYAQQLMFDNLKPGYLLEQLVLYIKTGLPLNLSKKDKFTVDLALPPIKNVLVEKINRISKRLSLLEIQRSALKVSRICIGPYALEGSQKKLERVISLHYISSDPNIGNPCEMTMPDKALSFDALFEILEYNLSKESYFKLADRYDQDKMILEEIKINPSEALKWVSDVQKSSENDFMYFF